MLAPVGWRKGIGLHARLVLEGLLQQRKEAVDLGEVLVLCFLNRRLSKIVAQHILGIHTIHLGHAVRRHGCVHSAVDPDSAPPIRRTGLG